MVKNILLIEDEEGIVMTLSILLNDAFPAADITTFDRLKNVFEYLDSPGNSKPDIILMDLGLPPNYSAERSIEQIPKLVAIARCPIIIITGSDDDDIRWAALDAGADYFWSKTRDKKVLMECIRAFTAKHQHRLAIKEKSRALQDHDHDRELSKSVVRGADRRVNNLYLVIGWMFVSIASQIGKDFLTDASAKTIIGGAFIAASVGLGQYLSSKYNFGDKSRRDENEN